ncbi:hypothetical protein G6F46_012499 [Rhizopus delemar]|uniref:CCHC-type domain-containing protein n=2 Tax=Rhizopus delemar TaxID=936053 RepID=I1BP53_RHIO9|nr:hypothetical protein RO3G_02687 [Rhizopus delemar RA 99-880]KAG1443615.1 hypothetical protein G6F55_012602 [Rhizopus delemar]KAG1617092.1 hypothetical protein G6F45_012178 [Rhizopus arrhizus]KAG1488156.1 hypothetical protein G6F54_012228 [Rhizopus delemar]KAG1495045.1 hypothetical protein G6F53_012449 [Rhizopus delemar]|eukprot:EIE77983.1 hypothetical protein RO3G_02687 [Rhizopus delemar RA 99-880]
MSEQPERKGWPAMYMDASSSVDKDASIGEGTGNNGQSVTLDNEVVKKLLSALSDGAFASHRIKVREPDLFYGERSSLAVTTWLDCLKTYFELTKLNNSEKMLYTVTLLRGDAQLWWSRTKTSPMSPKHWDAFCIAFAREFKPLNSELAARDKLAALYQHGSVSRYITESRSIQLQLDDLSKGDAQDKFVRGLKKNIRVVVRARFPSSLETAESMALAIESAAGEMMMPYNQEQMATGNRNVMQSTIPVHSDSYQDDPMDLDTIRQALNAMAYSRSNRRTRSSYQQGRQQVRCFGCQGYGHIKSECPTWRKNGLDNRRGGRFTSNNKNGHLNSVVPVKNQSSQAPLSHASANLDCDMDSNNLAKDQSYILNIESKETDLPLYEFGINVGNVVHAIKALLDTGASANYISPHLVNDNMKVISLRQARQVETAGGHIIDIKHKVEFSLVAQGLVSYLS